MSGVLCFNVIEFIDIFFLEDKKKDGLKLQLIVLYLFKESTQITYRHDLKCFYNSYAGGLGGDDSIAEKKIFLFLKFGQRKHTKIIEKFSAAKANCHYSERLEKWGTICRYARQVQ